VTLGTAVAVKTGYLSRRKLISQAEGDKPVPAGHRFAPPWSVQEEDGRFVVRDRNGRALSYVYFKDQRGWRTVATPFTRDEARHLAAAAAELPYLWRKN
jgi:hypothetical protein